MTEQRISSAVASNLASAITDFSVSVQSTEGISGVGETTYYQKNWTKYLGYYKAIPELGQAIDTKATWTVGKGFTADEITTMILDTIKGYGIDTFNTIIENMIRTYNIGGDAFAEIIRDDEDNLINLKPLDPASIVIVTGENGIIKRYEQISKIKKGIKKYSPEKILHFARNRVADEIHGQSIIERLETIILMRNEAMTDWKRVLHRNVDPMWIFHLDTDDPTKIAEFKAKADAAKGAGENMYVPKDAVVPEMVAMSPNASLNPLAWITNLNNYFFQACGVPQIIVGGSGEFTEATAKIAYLAWEQTIEEEQLYIEQEILSQLNLLIELEFPASLVNDLISDKEKDVQHGAIQKNETTAGSGQ